MYVAEPVDRSAGAIGQRCANCDGTRQRRGVWDLASECLLSNVVRIGNSLLAIGRIDNQADTVILDFIKNVWLPLLQFIDTDTLETGGTDCLLGSVCRHDSKAGINQTTCHIHNARLVLVPDTDKGCARLGQLGGGTQ